MKWILRALIVAALLATAALQWKIMIARRAINDAQAEMRAILDRREAMPGTDAPLQSLDEREAELKAEAAAAEFGKTLDAQFAANDRDSSYAIVRGYVDNQGNAVLFASPTPSPTAQTWAAIRRVDEDQRIGPVLWVFRCNVCGAETIASAKEILDPCDHNPLNAAPTPSLSPSASASPSLSPTGPTPSPTPYVFNAEQRAVLDEVQAAFNATLERQRLLDANQNVAIGMMIQALSPTGIDDGLTSAPRLVVAPREIDTKTGAIKGGFRWERREAAKK